jgi:hypothetical protein
VLSIPPKDSLRSMLSSFNDFPASPSLLADDQFLLPKLLELQLLSSAIERVG